MLPRTRGGRSPSDRNVGSEEEQSERRQKRRFEAEPSQPSESLQQPVPPPLFRNDIYQMRYNRKFANRVVEKGKVVSPITCADLHLETFNLFHAIGWGNFVTLDKVQYPRLVRIFYAHLEEEELNENTLLSYVKGQEISFTTDDLRRIFNIPEGDFQYYYTHDWATVQDFDPVLALQQMCDDSSISIASRIQTNRLTLEARILHTIIGYDILPKSGSRTDVTYMETFIIWCLLNGKKLDLAYLIFHHMKECISRPRSRLFYALPLTRVFEHFEVNLASEGVKRPVARTDRLTASTLNRMHFKMRPDGSWFKPLDAMAIEDEDEEVENEEGAEGDSSSMMAQIITKLDAQMVIAQRTEEKVETLRADFEQYRADSQEESTSLRTRFTD